jgi:cytochrome b6-f complex iron-sulfur subunit
LLHSTGVQNASQETLEPANGEWSHVAQMSDLVNGVPQRFTAGAVEGFLIRDGEAVQAVSAACTHLGCLVEPGAGHFWCPCRGATFGLDGSITHGRYDAPRPLPIISTRVQGNSVQVYVPVVA